MPSISRGQVVNQDPRQQAMEFAVESAQKAAGLIQNRKQLDLMEEELRQTKWRDLHNALMTQMEADAKTNQYGWRGAFENFKGTLGSLYEAGGMSRQTVNSMFSSIESSGLDPEVLVRASYSDFLTSDLSKLSSYDVQNSLEQQVKKMAIAPGEGYPPVVEQEVKELPPAPPEPPTKEVSLPEEERGVFAGARRRMSTPAGKVPLPLPVPPAIEREVIVRVGPMKPEEKEQYRKDLVEKGGVPSSLAKAIVDNGLDFHNAVEEWVSTGEITIKQKADLMKYGKTMERALSNPKYLSRLREELETPDETGLTTLQRIMINLGSLELGIGGNPQQQYLAGVGMANAILNPQALNAMANKIQAKISKEKHEANKNIKIAVKFPDNSTHTLNFEQFIAFMSLNIDMMRAIASAGGGDSGPLKDMNLDDVQKTLREMEKAAGIDPKDRDYKSKQASLMKKNDLYNTYSKIYSRFLSLIFPSTDEKGNPIPSELHSQMFEVFKQPWFSFIPFNQRFPDLVERVPGMATPWGETEGKPEEGKKDQEYSKEDTETFIRRPDLAPLGWTPPTE